MSTAARTIVVEARKTAECAVMLDALADACAALGHRVVRWRGPLSGRVPYERSLPVCDLAILFNGVDRSYRPAMARLRAWGAATLHVELGWHPQAGHYQVDTRGVNADASWAQLPPATEGKTPVEVRSEGDLLVLLQLDHDTQISQYSPWFASSGHLVRFLSEHSALPLRVRAHPRARNHSELSRLLHAAGACWDTSESLEESLALAKAVACINSSAAVAALDAHLPVLCYGKAVYRHEGVVYRLDASPAATRQSTQSLAAGQCELSIEAQRAMVCRIQENQWTTADVATRLPALLEEIFARTPVVEPRQTSSDRVERTLAWFSDLPARWLYRKRRRTTIL
jgi:hypothetical protein